MARWISIDVLFVTIRWWWRNMTIRAPWRTMCRWRQCDLEGRRIDEEKRQRTSSIESTSMTMSTIVTLSLLSDRSPPRSASLRSPRFPIRSKKMIVPSDVFPFSDLFLSGDSLQVQVPSLVEDFLDRWMNVFHRKNRDSSYSSSSLERVTILLSLRIDSVVGVLVEDPRKADVSPVQDERIHSAAVDQWE